MILLRKSIVFVATSVLVSAGLVACSSGGGSSEPGSISNGSVSSGTTESGGPSVDDSSTPSQESGESPSTGSSSLEGLSLSDDVAKERVGQAVSSLSNGALDVDVLASAFSEGSDLSVLGVTYDESVTELFRRTTLANVEIMATQGELTRTDGEGGSFSFGGEMLLGNSTYVGDLSAEQIGRRGAKVLRDSWDTVSNQGSVTWMVTPNSDGVGGVLSVSIVEGQ